jgi:hypothetical protein
VRSERYAERKKEKKVLIEWTSCKTTPSGTGTWMRENSARKVPYGFASSFFTHTLEERTHTSPWRPRGTGPFESKLSSRS